MSSTNKTPYLNLHSWVRTDPVVCDDFNDNFNKLDQVVGRLDASRGNCEIYLGSYTGTGGKILTLTFPKPPVYLVIQKASSNTTTYAGFVLNGSSFYSHGTTNAIVKFVVSGTTVSLEETGSSSSSNATLNINNIVYHYMAFAPAE